MAADKLSAALAVELTSREVAARILSVRGSQVLLDSHLAEMYWVETKALNRAVKRNADRFPESFCFQLSAEEWEALRCQIGTSNSADSLRFQSGTLNIPARGQHRKYLPHVFTEQGVAMLSAVLHSGTGVIEVRTITGCHDRFLILDGQTLYHIGASLKDLSEKCFAFSRMDSLAPEILHGLLHTS